MYKWMLYIVLQCVNVFSLNPLPVYVLQQIQMDIHVHQYHVSTIQHREQSWRKIQCESFIIFTKISVYYSVSIFTIHSTNQNVYEFSE